MGGWQMNILHINLEFDCAGVSWELCKAINKFTLHEARHVMRRPTHAAPNTDKIFTSIDEIIHFVEWADVLHFNQWLWTHRPGDAFAFAPFNEYTGDNPFTPYLKDKKIFFHFHGGFHQLSPEYWLQECEKVGAKMFKCDPYSRLAGAKWMPNVLDLSQIPFTTFEDRNNTHITIMGSRSDTRRLNSLIDISFKYLQKYFNFTYVFYDEVPRDILLPIRSKSSITIDNTTQGFTGMWGWEALALGQALIARIEPEVNESYETLGDMPPIINVNNIDDIARIVRVLINRQSNLKDICAYSKQWVSQYYNEERLVQRYVDEYTS
jgi:hypothetical protein